MARFYKGVGVGTFLHPTDLRTTGIAPHNSGSAYGIATVISHITRANTNSPCVSLTRSYGVARDYALNASRARPTRSRPAWVYEIDIHDPPPAPVLVKDPINEIVVHCNPLASPSYHHDGDQSFLLGVVDPMSMAAYLSAPAAQPPGSFGTIRPPNLSQELEAMVRALRDAEILVLGSVPRSSVTNRYPVF